jgi:hypothetical protein
MVDSPNERFKKYQLVESYEAQPGILIRPLYSAKNEICAMSIEKRHYFDKIAGLDPEMSREEILHLFDELVPIRERGRSEMDLPGEELILVDGGIRTMRSAYENVSFEMYGRERSPNYVGAIISWIKRPCKTN